MMYPSLPQSFFVGECFDAYRILGAHPAQGPHGEEGWRFNVWAPGATAVEICGGFDGWGPGVPMEKADTGLWSGQWMHRNSWKAMHTGTGGIRTGS